MHFCLRLQQLTKNDDFSVLTCLQFCNFHKHDFAFIFQLNLSHNKIPFVTRKMFPESRWVPYKLTHIDLSHNVMPVLTRFSLNPTFFDSTYQFTVLTKTRFSHLTRFFNSIKTFFFFRVLYFLKEKLNRHFFPWFQRDFDRHEAPHSPQR